MIDFKRISPTLPPYQQVAEQLRRQMKSGQIKPGDRLPSIAQMREKHGVSRPTMDKVHSILEQEGLVIRQPGAGTFVLEPPAPTAPLLAHNVIAVSGSGFYFAEQSPYWGQLMAGIRAEAKTCGFSISLPDHPLRNAQTVSGLLIGESSREDVLRHLPVGLPCVSLLMPLAGVAGVYADDYSGGRQATEYLLKLGHRRIGYLHGGSGSHEMVARRLSGYRDALHAAELGFSEDWERVLPAIEHDVFDPADDLQFVAVGRQTMSQWLKENWAQTGLTALLTQNDYLAIGAMEALRESGWSVPGDVSVVGFDGLEIGQVVSPRLTTIDVPLREIGRRAVQMLQAQIETGIASREHCMLPTRLRVGLSSCAPAS